MSVSNIEGLLRTGFLEVHTDIEQLRNIPIIGLVGHLGSGKGTVAEILSKHFNFVNFPISRILRDLARVKDPSPVSRETLGYISSQLADQYGSDAVISFSYDLIKNYHALVPIKGAIIDGIRHLGEAEGFKKIPNNLLIGVRTARETCFRRLTIRNRPGDITNYEEFILMANLEDQWMAPIFELADVVFDNDGSLEELEKQVVTYFLKRFKNDQTCRF